MAILASDIKLVVSKVMGDVPEGGGGPTSTEIIDGDSNQIFSDISEVDRASGVVNMSKIFVSVQTPDTDTLLGSNLIVAEPPEDPNIGMLLYFSNDTFDERQDVKPRIEAYLSAGPVYAGYLFGNHIAGQRTVTLCQNTGSSLPVNGQTVMLRKGETTNNPIEQYVRITTVTSEIRNFDETQSSGGSGQYQKLIVTVGTTDSLRADYPGFDVSRTGPTNAQLGAANGTTIRETVVADAATYYGVKKLTAAISTGDFVAQAEDIFSPLVPSAQTETPIADARLNQQTAALVQTTNGASEISGSVIWTTVNALFVGGSILPGTLSIARSGTTVTDNGGRLMALGNPIGNVDYSNGVLSLNTDYFGSGAATTVIDYSPAVQGVIVTDSISVPITAEGQRLNYIVTLDPIPTPGSTQASYRSQGRWYVLQDDGSGALRGSDSAFGAGMLNRTTGTLSVTTGALPDVGSEFIVAYASGGAVAPIPVNTDDPDAKTLFRLPIELGRPITPGTLNLAWNDGVSRTAADDSNGGLTGFAFGIVHYGSGTIEFSPTLLPAPGTDIGITLTDATQTAQDITSFTDGGANWTGTLSAHPLLRSIQMSVAMQVAVRQYPGVDVTTQMLIRIFDKGDGILYVSNITEDLAVGTVNYSTGAFTIAKTVAGQKSIQGTFGNQPISEAGVPLYTYVKMQGTETRSQTATFLNAPSAALTPASWAWFAGSQNIAAKAQFASGSGSAYSTTVSMDQAWLPASSYNQVQIAGSSSFTAFYLGSDYYTYQNNAVTKNASLTTGEGTPVGNLQTYYPGPVAAVRLTAWPAGVTHTATHIAKAAVVSVAGVGTLQLVDSAVFRTAVAPIKNGSFNIAGTFQQDQASDALVTFTATSDSDGVIASGSAVVGSTPGSYGVFGKVDYTFGVIKVRFGRRVPDSMAGGTGVTDLSYLGISGVTYVQSKGVQADTLRYNASAFSYIPLDADIIGIDPVRLPSDGRVPIFRQGSYAVIGESHFHTGTVANSDTVDMGYVRLARVVVKGSAGVLISTGYTADLEAGTVHFTDVTGYAQPVTIEARVEDMLVVSDAQINGQLTFTRQISHDYSVDAHVSSALIPNNLKARVSILFDQASWDGTTFSDTPSGSSAIGTYNDTLAPIEVTNVGASTERYAFRFLNSTNFQCIGEHLGVIGTGSVNADFAPVNPATGEPYFTILSTGWGEGWAVGNILRMNTVGALAPIWVIRTVQQGPNTGLDHSTTILVRGNVDRP